MLNSVPHSRTKWPPRRFIETARKTNPLPLSARVYAPTLPSIRISASPGQPPPPLDLRPVPTCSPSPRTEPPSSSRPLCSRNPQEFHFVCQPNYTPQFYILRPSYASPSLSESLFRERRTEEFDRSFLPFTEREILIRRGELCFERLIINLNRAER